jgi:HSP20 family protein
MTCCRTRWWECCGRWLDSIRAAVHFFCGRGCGCARRCSRRSLSRHARFGCPPTHLWDMHELKQARERLTNRGGREPRLAELAFELGWGVDRVADVVRSERQPDDIEGVDLVSHGVEEDAFDEVLEAVAAEQLRPLLLRLSQREREILQARAEGDSLRTIGRRLGVSGERVRSIEERALARIRAAANVGIDTGPRLLTHRREPTIRKEVVMNTLSRRDPLLAELDAMTDGFERMFGLRAAPGGNRGFLPPVDIWEDEHDVVIDLDVPGCDPDNLSAESVDGQLVVTGERTVSNGAQRRYRSERWQGRFVRSFTLPQNVDGDSIKADYVEGVLTIRLPKPEEAKPKRISIGRKADAIEASTN